MTSMKTSEAARALGRISTPEKAEAARENGRRGGRPIKALNDAKAGKTMITPAPPLPWEDFFAAMIEGMDPEQPPLPDYAVSREGIYEEPM